MADDDQTDDTDQDTGQTDDTTGDNQQTDDQGADQLADAGKQALDRMKAERNAAKAELRAYKALGLTLDQIKALQKPAGDAADKPDPEALRAEGRREATLEANTRILRSEVKAAAAGKLADPADAHRFLDLSKFEVDDDGNVDEDEIADAIEDLIKRKPYLAAAQGGQRRFQGTSDGGARKDKPLTLQDGNTREVMRLKSAQAIASTQ
jgi:hypothetical protein